MGVKCVLLYGCNTINITKSNVKKLETCLGKHVKTILGLSHSSRTTPILNTFNMDNILYSIDKYSLDLLKQCMLSNSAASCFYTHLYNENNQSRLKNTLCLCVNNICIKQNINVIKYVFNDSYALGVRRKFKNVTKSGVNGFLDSYGRGSKQKFSLLFGDFYSILHLVLLLFINNF